MNATANAAHGLSSEVDIAYCVGNAKITYPVRGVVRGSAAWRSDGVRAVLSDSRQVETRKMHHRDVHPRQTAWACTQGAAAGPPPPTHHLIPIPTPTPPSDPPPPTPPAPTPAEVLQGRLPAHRV